ncbi:MAG: hypothetical protein HQL32_01395 [Planctomycetes bacterium]|nr:hypothetical protein [Planctomycetota bacterium]
MMRKIFGIMMLCWLCVLCGCNKPAGEAEGTIEKESPPETIKSIQPEVSSKKQVAPVSAPEPINIAEAKAIALPKVSASNDYIPLDAPEVQPNCWGVYSWGSSRGLNKKSAPNMRGMPIIMKWASVEPSKDNFQFDKELRDRLEFAQKNDFYVFAMIWVSAPGGGATPKWLYTDGGVPKVLCYRSENPLGKKEKPHPYPYYLHQNYKDRFYKLIKTFGQYVNKLPEELSDRIIFVQIAEGSTGDGQPYKGNPVKGYEKYNISKAQWSSFRLGAWEEYKKYFVDKTERPVPLVVNADANKGAEFDWIDKYLQYVGVKQGMFTHGWHISDSEARRAHWLETVKQVELKGKQTFVRGEEDGEMFVYGRMTNHIPRGLYTSALHCLHNGVDLWNVPGKALLPAENQPGLEFFNKYAGKKDPRNSPAAFCALREGLDASDKEKFSEKKYGKLKRSNQQRYLAIAKEYSKYGAIQGDPDKAMKGGMINRKRKDYNDVGWGIITGNYYRFLQQIDAENTSQGWWHQGPKDSIYSQFARGFKIVDGQGAMSFRLHSAFAEAPKAKVDVRIVYLDRGKGSWSLHYAKGGSLEKAFSIKNKNSGKWKETVASISALDVGKGVTNFTLQYDGGDDTLFHLIEVNKR